jgi:predicted small integral membrane protein
MKLFGRTLDGFARALVALVAVFVLACVLCGLSLWIQSSNGSPTGTSNNTLNNLAVATGLASGAVIILSLLGIAFVALVWLLSAAIRNSSRP